MLRKIAWRNVWRNRRRSLITIASIFFAVFFAISMRSLQLGTYDRMINNVVNSYAGHIQVHQAGYWDDQIIDNAMELDNLPGDISSNVEGVDVAFPRIESFVLVATERKTKGGLLIGLNPATESDMLRLPDKLQAGSLVGPDDQAVMVGEGLARSLGVQVSDTLVLLGQGYHGATAAGKYPVSAVLKFPVPTMNNQMLLMPFAAAQELLSAYGMATSIIVRLESSRILEDAYANIVAMTDSSEYEVMTWRETMPELVQAIQADSVSGMIMIGILYVVVTFGIFGTLLMMMNERQFEFGVLLSVGMSRLRLITMTLLEISFLALIGGLVGAAVVYPLQIYFNHHPIEFTGQSAAAIEQYGWEAVMPSSTDLWISVAHTVGVLTVTLLISVYAVVTLARLKPVEAMRS